MGTGYKGQLLARELDIDFNEIELPERDEYWGEYKTPEGTYLVMTEDEADEAYREDLLNLLDDFDYNISDLFTKDFVSYIIDNCLNEDEFRDITHEDIEWCVNDNMDTLEVIDEARGYGLIDEDLETKIFEYEKNEDTFHLDRIANNLREDVIEAKYENYEDDVVSYFIDIYGTNELITEFIKNNHDVLDIDKIVSAELDLDGYGRLASWDGNVLDFEDLYAFKQTDSDDRSDEFKASLTR